MVETWVIRRFADYLYTAYNKDIRIHCPFCQSRDGRRDTKHHLYISLEKTTAHCFRCHWKSNHVGLIMNIEGCSYAQALQYLAHPPINVSRFTELNTPHSRNGLINGEKYSSKPGGFEPLMPWDTARSGSHERRAVYSYAIKRMTKAKYDIHRKHFGWVPGTNRLWITVDQEWYQGRLIVKGEPKYLNPPWPINDSLWNYGALKRYNHIVICEGVLSAIAVGLRAIAICSKALTRAQGIRLIESGINEITIMLDADARKDAIEMASYLQLLGFKGKITLHRLLRGDPVDSLLGSTVVYDWSERVKEGLGI